MLKPETKLMYAIFGEYAEPNTDEDFYSEVNGVALHDALMEAIDSIQLMRASTTRQTGKRIIMLRFGFKSPGGLGMTFKDIGNIFYVSGERIRQIEAVALRVLRHPSRSRKLKSFIVPKEHKRQ